MDQNITPTPAETSSHMEKHGHKYWALVLFIMGICLATAMYFFYKQSAKNYVAPTPATTMEEPSDMQYAPESTETSGSVELDQTMTTPNVTDDVLMEINDVENTDASVTFDESNVNDLE
jgi:hypothetical protein